MVLEDVEDQAVERKRQIAKWMIRGQLKHSKLIIIPKLFARKVGKILYPSWRI